ncbi:UNVERIFIED_CONTAM: hypothetical protein K2H54_045931 [Gekko kuhli]
MGTALAARLSLGLLLHSDASLTHSGLSLCNITHRYLSHPCEFLATDQGFMPREAQKEISKQGATRIERHPMKAACLDLISWTLSPVPLMMSRQVE